MCRGIFVLIEWALKRSLTFLFVYGHFGMLRRKYRKVQQLGVANHGDVGGGEYIFFTQLAEEVVRGYSRPVVEGYDDVAFLQLRARGRRVLLYACYKQTLLVVQCMVLAYARVYLHLLQHKAEKRFKYFAIGYKLAGYGFGGVYIYRKAQALRALYNGCVYAYHLAIGIDHRPTGIARIERCVRLDYVIYQPAGLCSQGAAQSAYHARGYGVLVAVGVAYGYDELADLQIAGIAELRYRVAVGIYLQNGQIGIGVFAYKRAFDLVFVKQAYHYFLRAVYHMAVGKDEAI